MKHEKRSEQEKNIETTSNRRVNNLHVDKLDFFYFASQLAVFHSNFLAPELISTVRAKHLAIP